MAKAKNSFDESTLRKLMRAFLWNKSSRRAPLVELLKRLTQRRLDAVLFGGALRDLMFYRLSRYPRDVDIVVDGASVEDLARIFSDVLVRKTRFGGLHLNHKGWMVDVWPLAETWAVREHRAGERDFEALTRTTFLNVEAVTIDLKIGVCRKVHASGFFEALQSQTLDMNLEENPFPELAAVRALITAGKLQYSITRRLANYVLYQAKKTPFEQLVSVQLGHYGMAPLNEERIHLWTKTLRSQIATGSEIRVPVSVQLSLWPEPTLGAFKNGVFPSADSLANPS